MSVVRSLERRLERLFEGVTGRVFSGRLHPAELAGRLAREADFARFEHISGPATANSYSILVNPADLSIDPASLETELADEIDLYAAEEGLRLEGPVAVDIEISADIPRGTIECHTRVATGPPVPWARLSSNAENFTIGRNRSILGRSETADVVLPHEDVSRNHALIWRDGGQSHIRDLGSSNGTQVDGQQVIEEEMILNVGSVITFATHRFRFLEI